VAFRKLTWLNNNLILKAPHPVFSGLKGLDERMIDLMKMRGGVLVFGAVTTANMSAAHTKPQVDPLVAHFKTLLTTFRGTWGNFL